MKINLYCFLKKGFENIKCYYYFYKEEYLFLLVSRYIQKHLRSMTAGKNPRNFKKKGTKKKS